jgi:hypothetical protein
MSYLTCAYLTNEPNTDHLIAITREILEWELGIGSGTLEIEGFYDLELSQDVIKELETKGSISQKTNQALFKKALKELIKENLDVVKFYFVIRSEPDMQAAVEWSTGEFKELTIEETQVLVGENSNLYLHIHSADD